MGKRRVDEGREGKRRKGNKRDEIACLSHICAPWVMYKSGREIIREEDETLRAIAPDYKRGKSPVGV